MGTTAQKLQYLVNAKAAIDTALTNKGVTPPTALADYGTAIGTLGYKDKLQQIVDRTVTEITAEDLAGCTQIGTYTFYNRIMLNSVVIPNTVNLIGYYAFGSCIRLTNIVIPSSVTNIRGYSFFGCESLTSINLPSSIATIAENAFGYCTRLTNVTILATNPPTLENANAFDSTNNCPIYVPAASVNAYKAATNWSSLADRIFAIQG